MAAEHYKLTYFNFTCLGESTRMLFHYGGIPFEDDRFEFSEWPAIKPNMPFGQVPILTINESKTINQSIAIARYAAKVVNLAGKDDIHALEIDSMVDNINDVRAKIADFWYQNDEVKEAKRGPLMKEILPRLLAKLETIAKENNGYFVRGELSWADVFFVGILDYLNLMLEMEMIEKYPYLSLVKKNVLTEPNIAKYIKIRPKTHIVKVM